MVCRVPRVSIHCWQVFFLENNEKIHHHLFNGMHAYKILCFFIKSRTSTVKTQDCLEKRTCSLTSPARRGLENPRLFAKASAWNNCGQSKLTNQIKKMDADKCKAYNQIINDYYSLPEIQMLDWQDFDRNLQHVGKV